jgi:hypothetical protein
LEYLMTFGKIFGVLVVLSLAASDATMARDVSKAAAGVKGSTASLVKGDKATAKSGPGPASSRVARPPAPIVMGRSASVHHKTKLHHIKMKPLEAIETSAPADNSR